MYDKCRLESYRHQPGASAYQRPRQLVLAVLLTRGKFPNSNALFETAKRFPDAPQATLHDVVTYGEDGKSRNLYDQTTYTFGTSYLVTSSITVRLLPQVTIATIHRLFTSGTNIVQRVKPWKLPIRVPEHFYRASHLLPCNRILSKRLEPRHRPVLTNRAIQRSRIQHDLLQ